MMTHGLSPNRSAADSSAPLPDHVPALRIDLRTRGIVEVSPALAALAGLSIESLLGRQHTDLWLASERSALDRRLDDVVLYGRDHFGCVMLAAPGTAPVWVELEAQCAWADGPHVVVSVRPLVGSPPTASAPMPGPPAPATGVDRAADLRLPATPRKVAGLGLPAGLPAAGGTISPVASPPPALMAPAAETTVSMMNALVAAGAAALAVAADGRVTSATPEAERLLNTPIARLRGARFTELLTFADQASPALAAARRFGFRQSVAAAIAGEGPVVALEWVPSDAPEAGLMVLVADQPTSEDAERLRLQTRLVSFIAHDVRNSLAAVFCGLRTLADQMDPAAPEQATLDKALADVRRASRIVDDVLTVSRPGRLNRVDLSLPTLLADCVNRFRARASAHGVQIVERYPAPAQVLADPSQLERAFDNLIENAVQAMPHGGQLTVAADFEERAGRGVLVAVADTGLGIPADVRPNVFEPYATRKRDGTGLGLAITLRAVLDHEGQISFTTAEGRGTTFSVWLPCN